MKKITYKTLMKKIDDGMAEVNAWEMDGIHADVTLYSEKNWRGTRQTVQVTGCPVE